MLWKNPEGWRERASKRASKRARNSLELGTNLGICRTNQEPEVDTWRWKNAVKVNIRRTSGEHQENLRESCQEPPDLHSCVKDGSNILKILRLPDLQKDLQNGAGFNCRVLLGGSSLCRCGFPPENMNLRFNADLILGSRTAVTHCFVRGGSPMMISACVTLSQHAAHISSFFFPLMPFLRDL